MKLQKILAFVLCIAMILSTIGSVAFAEDVNTLYVDSASTEEGVYTTLTAAAADAQNGDIIVLAAGEYDITGTDFGTVTVKAEDGVAVTIDIRDHNGATNLPHQDNNANVTFENVTLDFYPNGNYNGLQYNSVVYNGCTINGQMFLYALTSDTFNNCIFNQNDSNSYNVWTYTSKHATFNGCTFNCAGKSLLVYNEGAVSTVDVVDTEFVASEAVDGKAAIEISAYGGATFVTVDNETTAAGFATGSRSENTLWNVKDATTLNDTVVEVANEYVHIKKKNSDDPVVAMVEGESGTNLYTSIADAIAAIADNSTVVIYEGEYDAALEITESNVTVKAYGDVLFTHTPKFKGTNYYVEGIDFDYDDSYNNLGGTGKFVDCSFTADENTFRYCYASGGTIEFDGCTVTAGDGYWAIHFDQSDGLDLVLTDSGFTGRVALAGDLGSLSATETDFNNSYINVWGTVDGAVFDKCAFNNTSYVFTGYDIDNTVEFVDCTTTDEDGIAGLIYGGIDDADALISIDNVVLTRPVKVGDKYYTSLHTAITEAESGDTVEILKDITIEEQWNQIWNKANLIIDGNNHEITFTQPNYSNGNGDAILYGATNLTVNDLVIKFAEDDTTSVGFYVTNGVFTNVHFYNGKFAIYNKGAVAITNCTFNNQAYIAIYSDDDGNTTDTAITDCTFTDTRAYIARSNEVISGNEIICDEKDEIALTMTVAPNAEATVTNNILNEGTQLELYNSESTISQNIILGTVCGGADLSSTTVTNNKLSDAAKETLNNSGLEVESVEPAVSVDGKAFFTLAEAIIYAAPNGTVDIVGDMVVDEWIMFAEELSIGNGNIMTLNIDGLTINGNNHSLTVNSIESAGNGNRLFYDAENLNISDLTINISEGVAGGIGLKSGEIKNVTFNGGNGVFPGEGEITIDECEFNTANYVIYYETARDNLTVTNNTFNGGMDMNVILLRGNETFTGNTINSGRTVNIVSGSPAVSENTFADGVRLKVYNDATAEIKNNTLTYVVFDDETPVQSTFIGNILSEDAKAVLEGAGLAFNAKIDDKYYATLADAIAEAEHGSPITILADTEITGEEYSNIVSKEITLTLGGYTLTTSTELEDTDFIAVPSGYKIKKALTDDVYVYRIVKITIATPGKTYPSNRDSSSIISNTTKTEEKKNLSDFPFTDVASDFWGYEGIAYCWQNNIMNGMTNTMFGPETPLSRAMLVTMLYRFAGSPKVTTTENEWYSAARVWAINNAISDGTNMNDTITREQLTAMLCRYAAKQGIDTGISADLTIFTDVESISDWAYASVSWAVRSGLINGMGNGTLDPNSGATRAEVATIMQRFIELNK